MDSMINAYPRRNDTYDLVIKARGEIDMKQIVCFGDSNTYGYIPENGERYPWGVRWTSLLNEKAGLWQISY